MMRRHWRSVVELGGAAVLVSACITFTTAIGTPGLGVLAFGMLFLALHPFVGGRRRR